ncbi:MAG: hypothetical protein P8Z34_16845 [Anaerolineales bacterium]
MPDDPSLSLRKSILKPVLFLFASFTFVFCLGEAVHEFGHFLAHRAYGYDAGVILDPFGGSRTLGSASPRAIWGITSAAGPLFNLLLASIVFSLLWSRRRPAVFPFLLWGPVAMIQEGVTFSLGNLTPGGDAVLIVEWGVPFAVVLGFGIFLLITGIAVLGWLLPFVNLSPQDSIGRKFAVVAGGMVSFMLLRWVHAAIVSPGLSQENLVPLIFSLLLAVIVVLLNRPLQSILQRIADVRTGAVEWANVAVAAVSAAGVVLFQLLTFN